MLQRNASLNRILRETVTAGSNARLAVIVRASSWRADRETAHRGSIRIAHMKSQGPMGSKNAPIYRFLGIK